MKAHIRSAGLSPRRKRELMAVCREVAEPIERCCRTMGDEPLFGVALPCRHSGRQLEPCSPKGKVIRDRRTGEVVYAMGHTLEDRTVG
jgi:hypothetical protein